MVACAFATRRFVGPGVVSNNDYSHGFSRMFHSETTRARQSGSLVLWLAAWRHIKIYQNIYGLVIVPVLWSCLIILLIFCSLQSLCLAQAVVLQ